MRTHVNRIKLILASCLALVAVAFGTLAFTFNHKDVKAAGTTLTSTEYATDGSSIRVFRSGQDSQAVKDTGLRFHVEMGNNYSYGGTPIVNVSAKNEDNGSFMLNEGFKTYTIILPTRLLNGDLNLNTASAMKLDTSNYWYFDSDGNLESIAYVHSIPNHRYTDNFSFRGVICDANDNVIAQTPILERSAAFVAKKSYEATNAGTEDWGDETRKAAALEVLRSFIPTYDVVYKDANGNTLSNESVMWGDAPQNTPTGDFNAWYDEALSEEVDVRLSMTYSKSSTVTLTATKATEFSLTGIADINNIEFNGKAYSGAKIYATLPVGTFPYDEEFDIHAVNVEYRGNGTFKGLEKVFVLNEGSQDRIVFAFDSSEMISGAKIIIKGDSVFYIGGKMYQLTKDYEIDYVKDSNGNEDYSMFLGYIYNSDVKSIYNYSEMRDGSLAKVIRVEFYEDVFINSDFTFSHDSLPSGYEFPVYIYCPDSHTNTQIPGGYYYWNNGQHQILELNGFGNHNEDELYGAPGTKLEQNGGYYIFEDEMHAYYNGSAWVVGEERGSFSASSFSIIGTQYNDGGPTNELRFTTNNNWFNRVYPVTIENMSKTEPYAIYHTSADGEVTEMTNFIYHGASTSIFAFRDFEGTEAGETITIIKGTRIWCISEYWTASEDVVFYYNGDKWIAGSDGTADYLIDSNNFGANNFNLYEGVYKLRMRLDTEIFQGLLASVTIESGSITINGVEQYNFYYHGGGNRLFEITGDSSGPLGKTPFVDTLVIEAGTRLWMADEGKNIGECLEFTERVEFRYVGDSMRVNEIERYKYEWIKTNNNTNITLNDIARIYNETDRGGQVRVQFVPGIIEAGYSGYAAVDNTKSKIIVNGVEVAHDSVWIFNGINLSEIICGMTGTKMGDHIIIPAGTVWWTQQGSLTFVESIFAIYTGTTWIYGFVDGDNLDSFNKSHIERIFTEAPAGEIRIQLSKNVEGYTYYGDVVFDGDVHLTKANGTRIDSVYGYWYGGNTGYQASHSLLGIKAEGITNNSNGDLLTIKAGTRVIFKSDKGLTGYNVVEEDIAYIYQNGVWLKAQNFNTTFSFTNATVSVDGKPVQSGETIALYTGTYQLTATATNGYVITGITNATNNLDGTYTLTVTDHATITIATKQPIKLGVNAIKKVAQYDETGAAADCMGVRFHMDPTAFSNVNAIVYGLSWFGSITSNISGGIYHSSAFNTPHNFFELRFNNKNLKVGDTFTIKAGTVFDHNGLNYAIEWTEDIICTWNGSNWYVKLGDLDWNGLIGHMYSYSDFPNNDTTATPINHTIRINCNNALYNSITGHGSAITSVTINGSAYNGVWRYHGGANKILEISEWNYKSGDVLVIPAGTKIFIGDNNNTNGYYYYETVNTLSATCTADGTGAAWTWTIS